MATRVQIVTGTKSIIYPSITYIAVYVEPSYCHIVSRLSGPSIVMDVSNLISLLPLTIDKWADPDFDLGTEAGWNDDDS